MTLDLGRSEMVSPSAETESPTLAHEAFERLRADIISSRLAPGTKLRLHDLRDAYGLGLSPLREALSRLSENRLVEATGQRGFRVPEASVQDIMDIAMVRKEVEGFALRLSIRHGDDSWEAELVAARHKLALVERAGRDVAEDLWETRHRDFHYTLVSACQSPCLLHLQRILSDQFDRYRRLSAQSHSPNAPRSLIHKEILEAALARDADRAVNLLGDHITEATKLIVAGLSAPQELQKKPARKSRKASSR